MRRALSAPPAFVWLLAGKQLYDFISETEIPFKRSECETQCLHSLYVGGKVSSSGCALTTLDSGEAHLLVGRVPSLDGMRVASSLAHGRIKVIRSLATH